jgi:hypothetical protein
MKLSEEIRCSLRQCLQERQEFRRRHRSDWCDRVCQFDCLVYHRA